MALHDQPTPENQVIVDTALDTIDRAQSITPHVSTDGTLAINQTVHRNPDGAERVVLDTFEDLLPQPSRPRGTTTFSHIDSYIAMENRLAIDDESATFADPDKRTITTVLNYYQGWGDHRLVYKADYHPDFAKWLSVDGNWLTQAKFAEILQDLRHTIITPHAADVVQIARTFTATKTANFESGIHLQSGDVQLSYVENTRAKSGGTVEIPETITIRLAPYRDSLELLDIDLEFRFNAHETGLELGIRITRRDETLEKAWNTIHTHANTHLQTHLYLGTTTPRTPIR